jgi:phosphatidylglycerol:prolipoprotein diacylglycerol transferase
LINKKSPNDDGEGLWEVAGVVEGTVAARAGVRKGDKIIRYQLKRTNSMKRAGAANDDDTSLVMVTTDDFKQARWTFSQLPTQSLPTHPAQVYSSVTALLLSIFAWFAFPYLTKDGATLALVLTLYPACRFLLEWIRTDEGSQFGTAFTISQLVSVGIITGVVALWIYVLTRSQNRVLATVDI